MSAAKKKTAASLVWFEIPADDVGRARTFYSKLFGWKIKPFPMPSSRVEEYHHIDTGGEDASPDGGLMKRMQPPQTITQYVSVPSVTKYMAKVEKLGGKICVPKSPVPQMGWFAIVQDTENNTFAIWESDKTAK